MRMNATLTRIVEAERTEDRAMSAIKLCAKMCGSFFAMGETGDNFRRKWVIVEHLQ